MPSGGAGAREGDEGADPLGPGARFDAQSASGGGIAAVGEPGAGAAGAALGRARARAEAAMHPAAAVGHGGLAAAPAPAGVGAAARCGQEVPGPGAVPEPAAAI